MGFVLLYPFPRVVKTRVLSFMSKFRCFNYPFYQSYLFLFCFVDAQDILRGNVMKAIQKTNKHMMEEIGYLDLSRGVLSIRIENLFLGKKLFPVLKTP